MKDNVWKTSDIIAMAWCDKTSFEDIKMQTGLSESDVIALMRKELKRNSFRLWRKRVGGRIKKHRRKSEQVNKGR